MKEVDLSFNDDTTHPLNGVVRHRCYKNETVTISKKGPLRFEKAGSSGSRRSLRDRRRKLPLYDPLATLRILLDGVLLLSLLLPPDEV